MACSAVQRSLDNVAGQEEAGEAVLVQGRKRKREWKRRGGNFVFWSEGLKRAGQDWFSAVALQCTSTGCQYGVQTRHSTNDDDHSEAVFFLGAAPSAGNWGS